jgi:hypothetical protein
LQCNNPTINGRLRADVEHDGGVLCRLLELLAARGTAPLRVNYRIDTRAQPPVARLCIDAELGAHDSDILCARAAQAIGLLQLQ